MAMNSILNNYSGLTMSINSSSNMVSFDNFNLMKTPCDVDSNTITPIIFVRGEVLKNSSIYGLVSIGKFMITRLSTLQSCLIIFTCFCIAL